MSVLGSLRSTHRLSTHDALQGDSQFVSGTFETSSSSLSSPIASNKVPSRGGPSLSIPIASETGPAVRGSSMSSPIASNTVPSSGGPSLSIPIASETGPAVRGSNSSRFGKGRGKTTSNVVDKIRDKNGNKRLPIHIKPDLFKPVNGYVKEWTTEIGIITRLNSSLLYESWKKIPPCHKKYLFVQVMDIFEVDMNDKHVREAVEMHIKSRLRDYRHRLKLHYAKFLPHEVAIQNLYDGVPHDVWQILCDRFNSEKFKRRSAINSKNRKCYKIPHCGGSKSFVRYLEEMHDEGITGGVSFVRMYKETHYREGKGWTHPDAEELYEKMVMQSQANDGTMSDDFHIFQAILGDNPYYSRGLGYGMKPTSAGRCTRAELETAHKRAEDAERTCAEAMERVKQLEERMQRLDDMAEQGIEERVEQKIEERVGTLIDERVRAMFATFGNRCSI